MIAETAGLRRLLEAREVRLAGQVAAWSARDDANGVADASGFATPEAFVASLTGISEAQARQRVMVGTALDTPDLAPLSEGMLGGEIGIDAAVAIVTTMNPAISTAATPEQTDSVRDAVTELVGLAKNERPERVRKVGGAWRDRIDAAGVERRAEELRAARYLRFGRVKNGMTPVYGSLDPEGAAWARAAFSAQTNPKRRRPTWNDDRQGAIATDDRTLDQLSADAFVGFCRAALTSDADAVTGGIRPTVFVTMTLDQLRGELGAAGLVGSDEVISAARARQIAADADLIPAVLGGNSEILDLGHARRLFSTAQRRALALRDGGCVWPGCTAPPLWCEAHHADGWISDNGPTNLANGTLLCPYHHHKLDQGWILARRNGVTAITPPVPVPTPPNVRPPRGSDPPSVRPPVRASDPPGGAAMGGLPTRRPERLSGRRRPTKRITGARARPAPGTG